MQVAMRTDILLGLRRWVSAPTIRSVVTLRRATTAMTRWPVRRPVPRLDGRGNGNDVWDLDAGSRAQALNPIGGTTDSLVAGKASSQRKRRVRASGWPGRVRWWRCGRRRACGGGSRTSGSSRRRWVRRLRGSTRRG